MIHTYTFDELHVISDLHLGGIDGFQIFGLTAELECLIDYLAQKTPKRRLALVINGDFVDFLAEAPGCHFDPDGAIAKLDRIVGDKTFEPIWKALQGFVKTNNRTLLINIGNHDLELALPWVKEHLIKILSEDSESSRGRIAVCSDGTGILAKVGGAKVLCLHGNEVDDWNVGDHEAIRRIGRDRNFGHAVKSWIPNAGTQLVINVMNDLKRRYPFVDLLKPEIEAVIPILLALNPSIVTRLPRTIPVKARRSWDRFRMDFGFLGDEQTIEFAGEQGIGIPPHTLVGKDTKIRAESRGHLREASRDYAEVMLDQAEKRFQQKEDPLVLAQQDQQEGYLGVCKAIGKLATGNKVEAVREALEGLKKDKSFSLDHPDETYLALNDRVGADVDFVIAGHTHFERALPRRNGRGYYYNSGTWARLIQLDADVLSNPELFKEIFKVLESPTINALDAHPELVKKYPSFVSVWDDGSQTQAEIRRFHARWDDGSQKKAKIRRFNPSCGETLYSVVPESRFPKSEGL